MLFTSIQQGRVCVKKYSGQQGSCKPQENFSQQKVGLQLFTLKIASHEGASSPIKKLSVLLPVQLKFLEREFFFKTPNL